MKFSKQNKNKMGYKSRWAGFSYSVDASFLPAICQMFWDQHQEFPAREGEQPQHEKKQFF